MSYQRILIRMPNWIGDAVMAMPAVSQLRRRFPDSEISALAPPIVTDLLLNHPDLDRVLTYGSASTHAGRVARFRLIRSLRRERFDLGVLFSNSFSSAFFFYLGGVRERLGYRRDARGLFLTRGLKPPRKKLHQKDYYLHLVEKGAGEPEAVHADASPSPTLWLLPEERNAIGRALPRWGLDPGLSWLGINPGAAYGASKRWEPRRFAEVADRLAGAFAVQPLIFGGPQDAATALEVSQAMKSPAVVLAGKTSLRESMALLSRCCLFLTNDSGPMHIAAAFGVPVVAVFGPTDPEVTSPVGEGHRIVRVGVECSPCKHRICPIDHRCMTRLTPGAVFEEAAGIMGRAARRGGVAVFLDRDGTINHDTGYIDRPERLNLIPGAAKAIGRLNRAGVRVIVVSNQSAIGRGRLTREGLEGVHRKLRVLLEAEGARLDAIYACPHSPDGRACRCRKPAPGMILWALQDFAKDRIDLSRSYVVGDKEIDILLARAVGARPILVRTGYGLQAEGGLAGSSLGQVAVVDGLREAADLITETLSGEGP